MGKETNKRGENYTKEEDKFLFDNAKDMSVKDIAKKLGRPINGVRTRMNRLGIDLRKIKGTELRLWTKEDDEYLKENYAIMNVVDLAKKLDRTTSAIHSRKDKLEIENKNKPIPPEGRLRKSAGYLRLTMPLDENGKREEQSYHRFVYEKHHKVKLNKSEIIHHIDGDGFNNDMENLWYCKDISTHKLCHAQLEEISYQMVQEGFIKFDKETKEYYVNEGRYLAEGDLDA